MSETWNGFACERFEFEGQPAVVVFPPAGTSVKKLVLKTEYWNAFPDVERRLVERGFHLAYVANRTRFATREDCDTKARFVRFLAEKYGLSERCIPVGMSCGGAHAVRLAGFWPELVSCLFLDAPVLNYCSFPGKLGVAEDEYVWDHEFVLAYPGIRRHRLLGFSEHPLNMADVLIAHRIPVLLVYGTEDRCVNYEENGRLLELAYEGTGLLKAVPVPLRGHHPHGMIGDNGELVRFLAEHSD